MHPRGHEPIADTTWKVVKEQELGLLEIWDCWKGELGGHGEPSRPGVALAAEEQVVKPHGNKNNTGSNEQQVHRIAPGFARRAVGFIQVPENGGVMVPLIVAWKRRSSTASGSGYSESRGRCAGGVVSNTSLQTTTIAVMAGDKEEEECREREAIKRHFA